VEIVARRGRHTPEVKAPSSFDVLRDPRLKRMLKKWSYKPKRTLYLGG
jgi:hypothetical protein